MQHSSQPNSLEHESSDKRLNIQKKNRPKNLNLLSVKFPMSAIMSVGHRAAGILLFLLLPYILYFLQISLINEAGFEQAKTQFQSPAIKILGLIIIWALAHHFFAGIRFFLLDLDIGIDKSQAQKSAVLVMIAGFMTFVIFSIIVF